MTLHDLDLYFRDFLCIQDFDKDPSKNGVQVENSNKFGKEIKKIAFAVDACQETIAKAAACNADVLFVHHGLFWGHEQTITGNHYARIKTLLENDIALYACHIPLDANDDVGNNYGLAKKIDVKNLGAFGLWHSMSIGVQGEFETEVSLEEICNRLKEHSVKPIKMLSFGKKDIKTIAIVSGGAEDLLTEAIEKNIDVYITGELSHETYHTAKEHSINVIAGGHYDTEIIGVSLVAEKVKKEKGLETVFLDVPTGL